MSNNYNVRDAAGTSLAKAALDSSSVWYDRVQLSDGTNNGRLDDFDGAVDERLDSSVPVIAGLMALDTGASAGVQQVPLKVESTAQPNLRVSHWNAGTAMPAGASASTPIFTTEAANAANGLTNFALTNVNDTAQVIKGSAGTLYELLIYNSTGATAFVHVYNKAAASVVVGTDVPIRSYVIAAGTQTQVALPRLGVLAGTALSIGSATTIGGATGSASGVYAWGSRA